MRALIVSNMYPTPERPALGSFVADQVAALRRLDEPSLQLEVFAFAPGGLRSYVNAARALRTRYGTTQPFDVVHAHFGLTNWPALAAPARAHAVTLHGTDLSHPRSRPISLARLPATELVGVVSEQLRATLPRWAGRDRARVLPCGVDLHRFHRIDRPTARRHLGLDPEAPCLLFPSDPRRPEKRYDRARQITDAAQAPLLTLTGVAPERVPYYVNAANAVLIPSDREGFGLAVLEALACDVPVLATPVGIAPEVLDDVAGTLCAPFAAERWRAQAQAHLDDPDPRIDGRRHAEPYSSDRMALRVLDAWRSL